MYRLAMFVFAAFVLVLVSGCNEQTPTANSIESTDISLNKSSGPSANGQGVLIFDGEKQTFSFHASDKNGVVTGSIQVNARNLPDGKAHGTIDCMIVDGNIATLSGKFTDNGLDFGDAVARPYFVFQVIDNGEGKNSPKDGFSDLFAIDDESLPCDFVYNVFGNIIGFEIVNGNFQVKP